MQEPTSRKDDADGILLLPLTRRQEQGSIRKETRLAVSSAASNAVNMKGKKQRSGVAMDAPCSIASELLIGARSKQASLPHQPHLCAPDPKEGRPSKRQKPHF